MDLEQAEDAYTSSQLISGGSSGVGLFPNGSVMSTEGLTWDEARGRWDLSSYVSGGG